MAKYRSDIEAAGQVFQYLGLATPDSKATLGWKPTKRLLDLIAKSHAARPKVTPKPVEIQVLLDLMLDTMLGSDIDQGTGCFCVHILMGLGLVVDDSLGDWVPTIELLDLFNRSYYFGAAAVRDPNATYELVLSGSQ